MITLVSVFLLPRDASCRLTGEAELGYDKYDSSDNFQNASAHSFTQRYSVLYDTSGKFVNGRLGKYDVALGYEWLTFDTGTKSSAAPAENFGESKGHLYYRGEVIIDPKEVPFKLTIHSQDLNRSRFNAVALNNTQAYSLQGSSLPTPSGYSDISSRSSSSISVPSSTTTGITGGTRTDSGVTLVMGVKNGMTNGYNEFLRHFPMLLLDYRDAVNKDSSSLTPVDNRLTRLAFVSLNKKDNWFHYRYVTYDDYIDSTNNYKEAQLQLGTVDYMLQRRWIDFTNWLSVSVDGQFTKRAQERSEENFNEFSLNLFGTARRQSWELRSFNNFTRLDEINRDRITYMTSLPVYANGIISPTAGWSATTKYNDNHTAKGAYFKTASGAYNIDAFRKSLFTISQGLSIEQVNTSNSSDALIMTGRVSTSSTPVFSRNLSLKADYNIRNYRSTANGAESTFTDQEINGVARYILTNKMYMTARQTSRFTNGSSPYLSSDVPGALINSPQYVAPREGSIIGRSSYQSITELNLAWIPKPRLNVGFTVSEDIYAPSSGVRSDVTRLEASVDYTADKIRLSSRTSFVSGGDVNSQFTNYLNSVNSASYVFSRNLDAKVGMTYFKTLSTKNRVDSVNAEQSLNYYYYHANGIIRKLFEINEMFTSIEYLDNLQAAAEAAGITKQRTNTFLLGAKYYPLRQMMIAGGARYSFMNNSSGNETLSYYGSIALNFKLLDASLDYNYGKNKTDNRVDKRISANVKKRF
jgi:hypothetical protein